MATPASITEVLDNLYTTTWKHIKTKAADNIFNALPLFAFMVARGRIQDQIGGRKIEEPIIYRKNERVKWIARGGTVDLSDQEFLTETSWNWKYLVAPIVRFGVDDQQNRGKMQMINYAEAKLVNARMSLEDNLNTTFAAGAASGDELDGLQHLVADNPSASSTVGGIDQSTTPNAYWKNQFKTMASSSFATNGVDNMRTILNQCSNNNGQDRTDIIMCGQDPYEYYEDAILGKFQFENKELADLGFESQTFKRIPMTWSSSITDRMYFLNTRFLRVVKDPGLYFDMTPWKSIPNQVNDRAAQIISALAFTTNRRRVQGVIFSIDLA